jgi:Uma2 family endonuclease
MPIDTRLTYDDYCLYPEDGKRREIVNGEMFAATSPGTIHQRVVIRVTCDLFEFVEKEGLGEVIIGPLDVVLSEFDVVVPDAVYVSKQRAAVLTEKNIQGAPDLIIEVISAATAIRDRTIKLKLYGKFGVQEYWIIDPNGPSAEIYRHREGGLELVAKLSAAEALSSPMLPGFSVPLLKLTE